MATGMNSMREALLDTIGYIRGFFNVAVDDYFNEG